LVSSLSAGEATTIVRTRGMITIKPGSFAADLDIIGAVGIGVISDEAFGIGITAIPTPYSDADWPGWLMWESFAIHLEVLSAVGFNVPAAVAIAVDSKGMRKVGSNESLVLIAESQVGAFDIADTTRQLFKLS